MKIINPITSGIYVLILFFIISCQPEEIPETRKKLDLGGVWQMQLDWQNTGRQEQWYTKELETMVKLPGTLDENKKGYENKEMEKSCTSYYRYCVISSN